MLKWDPVWNGRESWQCQHCTFMNTAVFRTRGDVCEVCGLPRVVDAFGRVSELNPAANPFLPKEQPPPPLGSPPPLNRVGSLPPLNLSDTENMFSETAKYAKMVFELTNTSPKDWSHVNTEFCEVKMSEADLQEKKWVAQMLLLDGWEEESKTFQSSLALGTWTGHADVAKLHFKLLESSPEWSAVVEAWMQNPRGLNPLEISENLEQFHSDNRASVSSLAIQLPSSPTFGLSSELSKHLQASKTTVVHLKELQEYFGGTVSPKNDVPEIKLPSPRREEERKKPDSPVGNPRSRPGSEPVSPLPILACPWAFPASPELRSPRETNSPRPFQNALVVPEQEEMKTEE